MVPVGEAMGLLKSCSGMLMRRGAMGLQGGASVARKGGLFSSIRDWNMILMPVLGKRNTHLRKRGGELETGGSEIYRMSYSYDVSELDFLTEESCLHYWTQLGCPRCQTISF